MNNFNLSEFVKLTCWMSILVILWTRMLDTIPSNFTTWFGFGFFCFIEVCVIADGRRSTSNHRS